jgi:hypothetical protein
MAYNALSVDSGGDANSRVIEARKIVTMLADCCEAMTPKEASFVESMDECAACTVKQLFYLRDIKDKYL